MPHRAPLGCTDPSCPNPRPCPDHPPGSSPWQRRMPPGWAATRRRVLARDQERCQICGGAASEVHHLDHRETDDGLVSLCHGCHAAITQARALAARSR